MGQPFQLISERLGEGACALAIVGDLDLATAPHFRRGGGGPLGTGVGQLLVHLRATGLVDSTGLGALVWAQLRMQAAGGDLVVAGAHEGVRQTVAVARLDHVVELLPSREGGLARLGITAARATR